MSMNRREFLQGTIATSLLLPNLPFCETEQKEYNVVMLMSDEHNPRYASVYGHPFVQTPNMERMAKEGVVFENAYCPSPLCLPSRSSVMSGLYNHETQCYSNCTLFLDDFPNYGDILAKQGVHTVYIGKADVYRKIEEMGFSEVHYGWNREISGDPSIQRKPLYIRKGEGLKRAKGWGPREKAHRSDQLKVDTAVDWLKTKGAHLDRRFVLCVNVLAPHFPHFTEPKFWEMYEGKGDIPKYGPEQPSAQHPYAIDLRNHFETDQIQGEDVLRLRQGYYGCVSFVDAMIGKIMDTLEQTGLNKNTVFIYTSDHGEMLGKFGMWWKCSMFEDSARVPLLVCGPGFEKGLRVRTPVTTLDAQAGFFHATKRERPKNWKGTALQQLQKEDPNRFVFTEYHGHGTRGSSFMVRKGGWKFIWNSDAPHQLFNLDEDPEELNNLIKDNINTAPSIVHELDDYLHSICDPVVETQKAEMKIQKQLEELHRIEKG